MSVAADCQSARAGMDCVDKQKPPGRAAAASLEVLSSIGRRVWEKGSRAPISNQNPRRAKPFPIRSPTAWQTPQSGFSQLGLIAGRASLVQHRYDTAKELGVPLCRGGGLADH